MDINALIIAGGSISAVGVIQGLTKAAREAGLPSKYAPLCAAGIGAALGVSAALYSSNAVYLGLMGGVVAGLTSCGLYDIAKKAVDK